ncbi:MAG: ferredoxin III, nif-specific [Magnetococcales bacterium]|nr:ferredoxin III, nif-specific [Magnetococcales bacterium]
MSYLTGVTRSGAAWTPQFIIGLNYSNCIGCGRCYKVCSRNVFDLVERSELVDDSLDAEDWEDDDDGFDDDGAFVMKLSNMDDCIGCESCAKVCAKKCHTHEPLVQDA